MMVIPTNGKKGLNDAVAKHFGTCQTYTFLDKKGNVKKIIDNTSEHMGGADLPPDLLKKQGASILLCEGIGPRALDLCKKLGIRVYVHRTGTVREMFGSWKAKKARKAGTDDVCKEHQI
ncbi:MAG: NifB/NifX family molybdenum-iron cluster-binding protein [Candidatus Micrarchaeota archaeon]